ncbi:MAG: dihydropteroate synthase [Cytophagaceae bacterium]|nr:dihydropteroate synthase [Cytophagaceae bacterium]
MDEISAFWPKTTLQVRGTLVDLSTPAVMGILNVTPDSFYAGSRAQGEDALLTKAEQMRSEGATFLDVGGYSTRPGAAEISEVEETERVVAAIETLRRQFPDALISVDTFRATVAEQAVAAGAGLINDVAGGSLDEAMYSTVARLGVPYVLMHLRGTPQTMTKLAQYQNVTLEVITELRGKVGQLRALGVKDIVLDPGFGFAKTPEHNDQLLRNLGAFRVFELPLLVGLSRKASIWRRLNITPDEALNGTTVLNTVALMNGASILRVHDVKEAMEAVRLTQFLVNE